MNQSDELRGAIAKARLEEAQWWERLVDEEHHDEFLAEGEACIYCEHIAELKAAARQAAESPGRSELVMKLAEWLHLRISAVENSPLNEEEEEPCEDCENDAKQFIADNFLRTERSLAEVSADEIVKPDDQPENWCSTCNVKIVRRYCNDDGSLHVCNTYGGEKI